MAIIDRVKYDGPANVLVWRFPGDDLSWGTQVTVNQSQEAVFFKDGKALDVLGPGTHTLETSNIPLLRGLIKIPFGGKSPFAAEIYFVNKAVNLDVKWGTKSPIPVLDPKYNLFLPVRAFGQFGIKVADSRKFLVQLSGTAGEFTTETLQNYFRGVILTKAKDYIAETLIKQKINLLEISAYLEEISGELKGKIAADFSEYGLTLVNFMLESVNVPDEDESVKRLKKALADKAEINILGDDYKTKRTFDTLEGAAKNEGGGMGGGMGLGMGLGAGAGMGQLMAGLVGKAGAAGACGACKADLPAAAHFCPECGQPAVSASAKCPSCRADVAAGSKFCGGCGKKLV